MKVVSIVIPCYNEKNSILTVVNKVRQINLPNMEIIVVDDCSTDGTRAIIEKDVRPIVSQVIYHGKNGGKGAALRTGILQATGDVIIIQDSDLEYDPADIPSIVKPIFDEDAKVVYGSRFMGGWKSGGYKANRIANIFLTKMSNIFTHQKLTDMETCYKAFTREIIQSVNIKENRFGFEPEITAKISKMGIKIKEVPISYAPRTTADGKKIGLFDGFRAIFCIIKYFII